MNKQDQSSAYDDFAAEFKARAEARKDAGLRTKARKWFQDNVERLRPFGTNAYLRRYLFEPFNDLLDSFGNTTEEQVKRTITQVALANAVLAGLPGKLGVGVAVSMGLELWMAYRIAAHVGVRLERPSEVFAYVGKWISAVAMVGFLFVHVLRAAFALFAALPVNVPAVAFAEFVVTNFFGVLFWMLFEGIKRDKKTGTLLVARSLVVAGRKAITLTRYQFDALKRTLSPKNLKLVGGRLRNFLSGERGHPDAARQRGELFASAALATLAIDRVDQLRGPLGEVFLQSLRDRYPDLGDDAPAAEIGEYLRSQNYDAEAVEGVVQMVKGRMFERLVELHENADGDEWIAKLHADQNHPGSDIAFTNTSTGQEIEVSLKATDSPDLVEAALRRYPNVPVLTTSDVILDDSRVRVSDIRNEDIEEVSRRSMDQMMSEGSPGLEAAASVAEGTVFVRIALMWPTVAAYLRGKMTREQLARQLSEHLGDSGRMLAKRIVLAAALGPVYAWYLLARSVMELTPKTSGDGPPTLCLERRRKPLLAT